MIEPITADTPEELATKCNNFETSLPSMAVFATQTHWSGTRWVAFVYYRIHNKK